MEFEHAKAGKLVVREITQKMSERYSQEYRKLVSGPISKVEDYGATVKAAVLAGWIQEPGMTVEEVDGLTPWRVRWMAEGVNAAYVEATTVPKG